MSDQNKPIALEAYELLAQAYADIAETKAENGYNEHPAIRSIIGSVDGLTVLDAGCGPGFLARDLAKKGALHVTGVDISPAMIDIAHNRLAAEKFTKTTLLIADLGSNLPFDDERFDLIVSSLAIDYVFDWSVPLGEFFRILKPSGRLVFSVQHPISAYRWFQPPSAFGVHYCEAPWKGFTKDPIVVPDYYRSFDEMINPLLAAGFRLNRLHETKPIEALKDVDPQKYIRGSTFPTFMVIDATKAQEC
ncbi:MAG: class I SAM-dependent methyltransferase [Pseudomonadota bacterium]